MNIDNIFDNHLTPDSVNPLPIDEETLGAYLEGNLAPEEQEYVGGVIDSSDELGGFMEDMNNNLFSEDLSLIPTVEELEMVDSLDISTIVPGEEPVGMEEDPFDSPLEPVADDWDSGLYSNDDVYNPENADMPEFNQKEIGDMDDIMDFFTDTDSFY